MVTAPPLFNYGRRCPGFLVEMDGFEPPRFLQNRFTVCRLQPLGHISKKGRATVAGPSAPKRKYPGDVALKLVGPTGIEPVHLSARDFKSLVSTYFTTVPINLEELRGIEPRLPG